VVCRDADCLPIVCVHCLFMCLVHAVAPGISRRSGGKGPRECFFIWFTVRSGCDMSVSFYFGDCVAICLFPPILVIVTRLLSHYGASADDW
jgi:hypothetical protein